MNSAKSDKRKSAEKIHSAQNPRRFALKLFQRRRLMGDIVKRVGFGGAISWPGRGDAVSSEVSALGTSGAVFTSMPLRPPGSRNRCGINPGIGKVRDELHGE